MRAFESAAQRVGEGGWIVKDDLSGLELVLHRAGDEWWPLWVLMAGRGTRFPDEATATRAARRWERSIDADCSAVPTP